MKKLLILSTVMIFALSCIVAKKIEQENAENTMRDMKKIATAVMDYIIDNRVPPEQDGTYDINSDFYKSLAPFYLREVPIKDEWGNNYEVYTGSNCKGKYGLDFAEEDDFLIISYGRDKTEEHWEYNPLYKELGLYTIGSVKSYDKDIINYNGMFIRAPIYLIKKINKY